MNVLDAAANVGEDFPGGATALAHRIDKNATTLLQELRGTGGAKLGLLTAVKMTQRSGDLRILQAFAGECGQMCMPLPEALAVEGEDLSMALSATSREFADLCQAACVALADGRVTDNELHQIEREGGELVARLHGLLRAFSARCAADKPSALRFAA